MAERCASSIPPIDDKPPSLKDRRDALAEALLLLEAALEATGDAILVVSADSKVTFYNQQFIKLWNVPDDVAAQHDDEALLQFAASAFDDPPAFIRRVHEIVASANTEHDELHTSSGRVIERVAKLQYLDDEPVGRVWSFRDITERRAAEDIQARLAAVVEGSEDAIITKTLDGIITTWNAGAERMFGYRSDEIVGKPVTTLFPPDKIKEEREILARLSNGERIDHYEAERIAKDGRVVSISLTISPLRNASGETIGASKIARDITEKKRSEEALREETEALETINETGLLVSSSLRIEEVLQKLTDAATNLSAATIGAFFYRAAPSAGHAFELSALSGEEAGELERFGVIGAAQLFAPELLLDGVSARAEQDPTEQTHTVPSGRSIRVDDLADARTLVKQLRASANLAMIRSYLAVPVVSRSGQLIGGLFFGHRQPGVFTGRTERILAGVASQAAVAIDNARLYENLARAAKEREELLEAERAARSEAERMSVMKDEFLATLSHELRTPLNAILGWSQLLSNGRHPPEELGKGLEIIQRNARVQTQIIEDLLDMSRIISGKVRLDIQWTDLAGVVEAAVDSVRPSAEAKGIRLRKIVDPRAGPVTGDPTRLQQVVWNLLTNAIKFTPKGGKVDLVLKRVNSHVEIMVHDSGIGIEAELLPVIFDRFRQGDSSASRAYSGLGIGLSIVKNLIELHGGTIDATSPGKDAGSTFTISLPLAPLRQDDDRAHPTSEIDGSPASPHFDLSGIRVLVVDDEPDARALIGRLLLDCGVDVRTASSAEEALTELQRSVPDAVVSDIGMPHTDGYELMRRIRRLPAERGGKVPAVALTAFARSEDRTRAILAGYQIHVSKPIEPRELVVTVASLVGRTGGDEE